MKYLKYTREILIIGLVLFVILLFVKPCGKAKQLEAYRILQAHAKTLEAKVKADSIARNEERKAFQAEKKETEGKRQLAEVEKTEADNKVQAQQKTIDRLAATIRRENIFIDTTVYVIHESSNVWVSKEFKAACDSLPAEIDKLNLALADKDSSINGIIDLYNYEIQIRDEELFKEMNYSDSLMTAYREQRALFNQAMRQGKPRGKLLGGLSVIGNEEQFISGAGPVIAYQTKSGKQYQASAKPMKLPTVPKVKMYYEGTVLFTIFR